jgi:hypothetical protein
VKAVNLADQLAQLMRADRTAIANRPGHQVVIRRGAFAFACLTLVFDGLLPVPAAKGQDICWTRGATQFVAATHFCVSSALAPHGGRTYGPENLADNDSQTAWCEGVSGNGIGETITIRINEGLPFRRLIISNGYGKSSSHYADNSRIKTVDITSDTGTQTTTTLIDQNGALPVYLPGMAQDWVRLTIRDVYPGNRFADTCVDMIGPDFEYEEELLQRQTLDGLPASLEDAPDLPPPPSATPLPEDIAPPTDGLDLEGLPDLDRSDLVPNTMPSSG